VSGEVPQAPETMTPAQLARRQRLVDAVVELIGEGRDEELQMKEISERAGVALGTVYRYFSSKDHLLAAALVQWAGGLATSPRPVASRGEPAEQLRTVLHQALRAYRRQPNFARILVAVSNSSDPYASECFQQLGAVVFPALTPTLDGVEGDRAQGVLRVVGAVWYHGLSEWVKGRMSIDEVEDLLDRTCNLLLAQSVAVAQ
jgi:TetR/AcrR family transcriptional regulator, cholesterol catabolism regulator